jgi:hypothetical protein
MVSLQGNNLELTVFATGGGYNGGNDLSHSLSLYTIALFTLAPTRMAKNKMSIITKVCP